MLCFNVIRTTFLLFVLYKCEIIDKNIICQAQCLRILTHQVIFIFHAVYNINIHLTYLTTVCVFSAYACNFSCSIYATEDRDAKSICMQSNTEYYDLND